MSFACFGIALAAYYFLHSFLADEWVKQQLQKRWIVPAYYRLFYNGIAILLLGPLFWAYWQLPIVSLWNAKLVSSSVGWILLAAGSVILLLALKQYDLKAFSGWKQWRKPSGKANREVLQTGGINRLVRHPLYLGSLLLFWGFFLQQAHLAAFLLSFISTIYLIIGTLLEEQKLLRYFGQAYRDYSSRVPMLWPSWSLLWKVWKRIKL